MFGHDNQDQPTNDQTVDDSVITPAADAALDTSTTGSQRTAPDLSDQPDDQPSVPPLDDSNDNKGAVVDDGLLTIKRQALQQLSPLVGHLDQSPEEKFKTTMMMIQAADDKTLVQTAYEAAQQISDEKTRAQALLDVINEINYFTHPQDESSSQN